MATVSREWQTIIERHNFARIKLTPSRLADFGSMVYRNRALVDYIWLCLELNEYECAECEPQDPEAWAVSDADNMLTTKAFEDLFSAIGTWEPNGDLLLDISVHSPSDSKHWFKYLTFEPDTPSHVWDQNPCVAQAMLGNLDDHQHGWIAGNQNSIPSYMAIHNVFEEMLSCAPFNDDEQENQWWQQLPAAPAVTGVLLRQQNRRRWMPTSLAQMFSRLPELQEVYYEPWREWEEYLQKWTDKSRFVMEVYCNYFSMCFRC
jgi:hypothetical protein